MKEINAAQLAEKITAKEEMTLIDVREAEEVAYGMIPGSIHIPLGSLPMQLSKLSKHIPYIIICRSGSRSGLVAQMMESNGYDATNYVDGIIGWTGETVTP